MTTNNLEITPEEHGAVGDGNTDDGPAIQAAIDFLAANGGGVLRLAAKTYSLGPDGLKLGAKIELRGQGDASVLQALETETNFWLITSFFAVDSAITNLKLDGNEKNRQGNDSVHGGILLEGCQACRIENCTLTNFGRRIVPPQGSLGAAILVRVREKFPQDSVGNRILNNKIIDNNGYVSFAIRIWSDWTENLPDDGFSRLNKDNVIEGNHIEGTRWNAIEIAGPASRSNTVTNNIVKNTFGHRGVEADKGALGNTFVGNIVDGIHPGAGGAAYAAFCDQGEPGQGKFPDRFAQDNTWIDNLAKNGVQDSAKLAVFGFYGNGSKRVQIKGLRVEDFVAHPGPPYNVAGIWIDNVFEDAKIEGCVAKDVPVGIVLENGHPQDNIQISVCELRATHRSLWLAQSAGGLPKGTVSLAKNIVHCDPDQGEYAVLVNGFDKVMMTGNNISGKRLYVGTSFEGEVTLEGNDFANINDYGIYVQQGTAHISGNKISGCTRNCIELHPGVHGCVVSENILQPTQSQEACRDRGDNNIVRDNQG